MKKLILIALFGIVLPRKQRLVIPYSIQLKIEDHDNY